MDCSTPGFPVHRQLLKLARLFATPLRATCQASLSITNSWSLLKLMSIKSVMPYNHLVLYHPLLLSPSIFPSIRGLTELNWSVVEALNNWCFCSVMLEKTLESLLDCKEIQPVHPKGNQSWMFIGGTDAEAETPILWPPDGKNWLIWKDPDAGKDWRREEKGMTEDEMAGWHHRVDGCMSLSKFWELVMDREA